MRHRPHIALASAALSALALTTAADARSFDDARFTARISGTYDVSGTVTNSRCFREDEAGNVTYFTATGNAAEHTTFRAKRGALLGVSRTRGERRIVAGGPAIPVTTTTTRTSTLPGSSEPQGCRPNSPPPACGTKTKSYKIEVYGVGHGFGFSYNLSNGFSTSIPDDPFEDCPLPEGASWWGSYYSRGNGVAKVSTARLFNRRVKKIVVKGRLTKSPVATTSDYSARSTETLSWTLTLKRRR
jgi:hypothetical protein